MYFSNQHQYGFHWQWTMQVNKNRVENTGSIFANRWTNSRSALGTSISEIFLAKMNSIFFFIFFKNKIHFSVVSFPKIIKMHYVNITRLFHKLVSPSLQVAFKKVSENAHNRHICLGKLLKPQNRLFPFIFFLFFHHQTVINYSKL